MEKLIPNYWHIKSIGVLKTRYDFPPEQKEKTINEYVATTNLSDLINATQLTSFNVVKRFENLIPEVMKVLDNAENEFYFATRYYDPYVSKMVFEKFSKDVAALLIRTWNKRLEVTVHSRTEELRKANILLYIY